MNADSNDNRELESLHAACPIEKGEKMAVSLWIRGNFQDQLKCPLEDERYNAKMLVTKEEWKMKKDLRFMSRPQIQLDYEDNEDELWPVEDLDEEEERSYDN